MDLFSDIFEVLFGFSKKKKKRVGLFGVHLYSHLGIFSAFSPRHAKCGPHGVLEKYC